MVSPDRRPRVAVFVHLAAILPRAHVCGDTGIGQVLRTDAVFRQLLKMDRVDLHEADVVSSVLVLAHGPRPHTRLMPGHSAQNHSIDLVIGSSLFDAVSRTVYGVRTQRCTRESPSGKEVSMGSVQALVHRRFADPDQRGGRSLRDDHPGPNPAWRAVPAAQSDLKTDHGAREQHTTADD